MEKHLTISNFKRTSVKNPLNHLKLYGHEENCQSFAKYDSKENLRPYRHNPHIRTTVSTNNFPELRRTSAKFENRFCRFFPTFTPRMPFGHRQRSAMMAFLFPLRSAVGNDDLLCCQMVWAVGPSIWGGGGKPLILF